MNASATRRRSEAGATLIEVIAALSLMAILITLGFGAIRHFWRVNSLDGASSELTTQFRRLQQEAVTGDSADVYGAVLNPGADRWNAIRFSPKGPGSADDECDLVETRRLSGGLVGTEFMGAGVTISSVEFESPEDGAPETAACAGIAVSGQTVFFYRRGNATGGYVDLYQDAANQTITVAVCSLTGRVEMLLPEQEPCSAGA
jgi:type II secretory pathway pseudopilin PulG